MIAMLCFYSDERAIAEMPPAQANALVEAHVTFSFEVLLKQATLLAGRGLAPTAAAKTVYPGAAGPVVADGPHAVTERPLTGFYLVECRDMAHAVELAEQYPMPEGLGSVEVRPVMDGWDYTPSVDSAATPQSVWECYADTASWPQWKAGVSGVELDGPFAAGTAGHLIEAEQGRLPFRLVDVHEGSGYVSETEIAPGIVLRLEHELQPLADGGTRITHRTSVPRDALDVLGWDFSPRLNDGMRATLDRLSAFAASRTRAREDG